MPFYADLHIHSKHSLATSRDCDLEHLAWWARRKGIAVVATGDFTHPKWFEEIRDKLVPAEPGLFRLRPELEREIDRRLPPSCRGATRFLLEVEISTIYKKGETTRKVHHLIYAPDLEVAGRFRDALGKIGNISSDGRPILGLDSRHLLEITLESGPGAYLVPAHVWTPWFAVLGSKSGFDSVEECYGDLAEHIFAVETGLSSDPPMNWRVSSLDRFTLVSNSDAHSPPMLGREACVFDTELDYFAMRRALETGRGYGGTLELFPEEGKYHMDGHRPCGVCLEPEETRRHGGRCPSCGKPLTVGVMHRVQALADRPAGQRPPRTDPFRSLVPLPEIVSEIRGVGPKSKTVQGSVADLVTRLGPELEILETVPPEDVRRNADPLLAEALDRLRQGRTHRQAGYDGEYGVIRLFEPGELDARHTTVSLFGPGELPEKIPGSAAAGRPRTAADCLSGADAEQPEPDPPTDNHSQCQAGTASFEDRPQGARPQQSPEGEPADTLLGALDPDQRAAAEITSGPLLIVAGPGTGKTRTLTHRLAHLIASGAATPEQCLAITFTRRAAGEMRERLKTLVGDAVGRMTVTTFHGLGRSILGELAAGKPPRVAGEAERLTLVRELFALSHRDAARWLEAAGRSRRQAAEAAAEADAASVDGRQLALYEQALRDRGLVDFDDLLLLPLALLTAQPLLLASYRDRFRHLAIDEYQDIDALQYRLVRLLAPADGNICAIGDPDQSIYRFRGADVGFFLRFREDYPTARTVELTRNYRSNPGIVDAALAVIGDASLVPRRQLRPMLGEARERVALHEVADERAEAELVTHTIEKLLGGTSYYSVDSGRVDGGDGAELCFDDFAVLYRTDAQSAALIEALERSGIPFQKRSHGRLGDRPAVRRLLEALRREPEPRPLPELLAAAAHRLAGEDEDERTALAQAVDLLAPLAEGSGDLDSFLTTVALGAEVDTWDPRAERVSLLTLHAAKGLEFRVVFLVGCCEGLLPLSWSAEDDPESLDEERRLLFVGMTRARSRLVLSCPRQRRRHGELRPAVPSRFLADLGGRLLDRHKSLPSRPPQRRARQLRLL